MTFSHDHALSKITQTQYNPHNLIGKKTKITLDIPVGVTKTCITKISEQIIIRIAPKETFIQRLIINNRRRNMIYIVDYNKKSFSLKAFRRR